MRNGHADLIVIGAGVLGAFHAYFAARRGLRVLLLERDGWPAGASARNFGIVTRPVAAPGGEWAAYVEATRAIYQELQAEGDISVRPMGSLYLAQTEREARVLRELPEQAGWGDHCIPLGADEVCDRYPWVRPAGCAGALLLPDDLSLDPRVLLQRLLQRWIVQGLLRYRPHTNIVSVTSGGLHSSVLTSDGAVFQAERVLVCGGAEYRTLFPAHLRASGLRLCKAQMLRLAPLARGLLPHALLSGLALRQYGAFQQCPSYPLLRDEPVGEPYGTWGISPVLKQEADGSVTVGGSHEYFALDNAGAHEERSSQAIHEAILAYGRAMLSLPAWQIAESWNGYYLAHPELPIFSAAIDGRVQVVTGIGEHGMSLGPGYAQAMVRGMVI